MKTNSIQSAFKFSSLLKYFLLIFTLCINILSGQNVKSGKPRNLLSGKFNQEDVKHLLLSKESFHPFPNASERQPWENLPSSIKQSYIAKGEKALNYQWPSITAEEYLDYSRTGSREKFSAPYNERRQKLVDLVLAECIEGKGRFLDQIANGIWLICEETSWTPPFHIVYQKTGIGLPDINDSFVDLSCSETGNLIAWTYYLLGKQLDRVSPLIQSRISAEMKKRILIPCLERDDYWWMWTPGKEDWSHVINNWVPWICSNWLASELLIEEKDDLRYKSVFKIMQTLDRFINSYPDDGGCDEGPSYFDHAAGSLFESLELLSDATKGKIDIFNNSLVQDMGRYIYRAYIKDNYYVNSGDASAKVNINADLVQRYGMKIKDENLAGLGTLAALKQGIYNSGISGSLTRQLYFLFDLDHTKDQLPKEPLIGDLWLPDTKLMAAREHENSSKGFYISAIGSHNDKSHNHNDVGNFIIYSDGEPCIVDAGLGTYTAKTFSDERYSIWTMQSAYHNLPTINGIMQKEGRQYAAKDNKFNSYKDSVVYSLDLAEAYPKVADINNWIRTIKLDHTNGSVGIKEDYAANSTPKEITLSLMTPCIIDTSDSSSLTLIMNKQTSGGAPDNVRISFDKNKLTPEIQTIKLDDKRLKQVWGNELKRILFHINKPESHGTFSILFTHAVTQ